MDTPTQSSIARLFGRGPNAEKIRRLLQRFSSLSPAGRELLLIALDIEEGLLPLIAPGGRASRREVLSDKRLIAVGDDVDYGKHISYATGAAAAPAASAPAPEAAKAPHSTRDVSGIRSLTVGEVIAEDRLGMDVWFPQFVLGHLPDGTPAWRGEVRPLSFSPHVFDLVAAYQQDFRAPLAFFVLQPPIHPQAPHRFESGALCTFFAADGSWVRGRAEDDLVELMRFAIVWLIRYECWMVFDRWWPGVEAPHEPEWLLAHLQDDDFCPYHHPRPWGACCKPRFAVLVENRRRAAGDAPSNR